MDRFATARDLVIARQPDQPTFGLRPHAAGQAARWFLTHFPGDVAYAVKANASPFLLGALYGAGIRHFDVASLPEIEDVASIPDAHLHFMHPVKSRNAIRRAFFEFGVRSFSLDCDEELTKIQEETGNAADLTLWVRIAVQPKNSKLPLERMFGIAADEGRRFGVADPSGGKEAGSDLPRRVANGVAGGLCRCVARRWCADRARGCRA